MARIPYPDPSHRQAKFEVPLNLFRMLAHAETTAHSVLALGAEFLGQLALRPRLRELAILQVAHLSGSRYVWAQHAPIALLFGITQEQIEAIQQGTQRAAFQDEDQLILQFTAEIGGNAEIPDVLFE